MFEILVGEAVPIYLDRQAAACLSEAPGNLHRPKQVSAASWPRGTKIILLQLAKAVT